MEMKKEENGMFKTLEFHFCNIKYFISQMHIN